MEEQPRTEEQADHVDASGETFRLNFDMEKSAFFRVIYVDGGFGGVAPSGMVEMGLFNERSPIPKRVWHDIDKTTGRRGQELEREGQGGIFREVECVCVMRPQVARDIATWLLQRADDAERAVKEMEDARQRTANGHVEDDS